MKSNFAGFLGMLELRQNEIVDYTAKAILKKGEYIPGKSGI